MASSWPGRPESGRPDWPARRAHDWSANVWYPGGVAGTSTCRGIPFGAFSALVGDASGNPAQLVRRAMDALLASDDGSRVLVCVDDAHHLDDLSSVLLLQLVLQARADVVVTLRSGEVAPEAVSALWSRDIIPRIDIQALSDEESIALINAALGDAVDDRTGRSLCALARGNVLFVRQVVDGERAAGRLRREAGTWQWSGQFHPSAELTDLIGSRIDLMTEPVREIVDVLAVAGPLELATLTRVCDRSQVEEAENAGLVQLHQTVDGTEVGLGHPLYGEVRRARIGELTARRLRGTVVRALETATANPGDILRRAVLSASSDLPPDPDLCTAGANHAIQLLNWDLAERLARSAVAAGGGWTPSLDLGYVLGFGNHAGEAEVIFEGLTSRRGPSLPRLDQARDRAPCGIRQRARVPTPSPRRVVGYSLAPHGRARRWRT